MSVVAPVAGLDLVAAAPLGATFAAFVTPGSEFGARFPLARGASVAAWRTLAEARLRRGVDPGFAAALVAEHARLEAPAASRAAAQALADGRAVAVVAGQQPGPLGGPLYTWHKALTAVALARALEQRLGVPAVPVFWNATEDDDFDEISSATWAGPDLAPVTMSLPREAREAGRLVGALPAGLAVTLWNAARGAWAPLPGSARVAHLCDAAARTAERGGDLGDLVSRLVLEAFAEDGLVVLDPRWPAFRAAARPLYDRYLEVHPAARRAVDEAGERSEAQGMARGFTPLQTEFALFAVDDGRRRHLGAAQAAAAVAARAGGAAGGPAFTPGAMLRPIAQDFVLPSVALVAGPGEVAYLAQLPGAYAALGVDMGAVVPRWSATWLPPVALEVAAEAGVSPDALVEDPDGALAAFFESGVPAALAQDVAALRAHVREALARLGEGARALDASLPQFTAATGARVDWRLRRLFEGFVKKARRNWRRAHPEAAHLRSYLRPHGRLQERTLAWLDVLARGGTAAQQAARERARVHVDAYLDGGALQHDLMPLGPGPAA